jgi:hypothetical protein
MEVRGASPAWWLQHLNGSMTEWFLPQLRACLLLHVSYSYHHKYAHDMQSRAPSTKQQSSSKYNHTALLRLLL